MFLQYFKALNRGVVLAPLFMSLGGQKTPLRKVIKVLPERYLCTKHAYLF